MDREQAAIATNTPCFRSDRCRNDAFIRRASVVPSSKRMLHLNEYCLRHPTPTQHQIRPTDNGWRAERAKG